MRLKTSMEEIVYLKEVNQELVDILRLANHYLKNNFTETDIIQKHIKDLILKSERGYK